MQTLKFLSAIVTLSLLFACASGVEKDRGGGKAPTVSTHAYGQGYHTTSGGGYSGNPVAAALIDKLVRENGFDRSFLEHVFSRVERQPRILSLIKPKRTRKSGGPTGAWNRYRAKFVTQDTISKGINFWRRYAQTLRRAEATYGVPPEYVVAIIGVETRYGGYTGNFRVIDALSTLAFEYPPRSAFFTGELESFLIMAREVGFDPFQPRGSYAGAMGLGQFMPSSFLRWAVDFNGDGNRDLWNPIDAIGSVANYFKAHGWRGGAPVIVRTEPSRTEAVSMETGFDTSYSPKELVRQGIVVPANLPEAKRVSLIKLDARGGYQYWLGFKNFYVITRYNHSSYYAMAVHQLAQALRGRHGGSKRHVTESGLSKGAPAL